MKLKTSAIALAVAGAMGASMVAQAESGFYGSVRIGFQYLDTGAMYRAVTWSVMQQGMDPSDREAVAELARQVKITFENGKVLVKGADKISGGLIFNGP